MFCAFFCCFLTEVALRAWKQGGDAVVLGAGALQSCWQHLGRAMGWAIEAGENRIGAGGMQIKLLMFPEQVETLIQVGLELFFGCSSLLVSPQACHGCVSSPALSIPLPWLCRALRHGGVCDNTQQCSLLLHSPEIVASSERLV